MKIMTILGTRPEIIRLSRVIQVLDTIGTHVLVHTGQNYADSLKDIFFKELGVRQPDYYLGVNTDTFCQQIGSIFVEIEKILQKERPDKILILGDTNSGLSAIIAERLRIPVYHMEAGNRCHDLDVPEEINRKIIDAVSTIALPYTQKSRENLLRDGVRPERIYVSGNPINEVLNYYAEKIDASPILAKLGLEHGKYFLMTAHRAENVDVPERLASIFQALDHISEKYKMPIICSIHPRTRIRLDEFKVKVENPKIQLSEPFGFFDFVKLEKNAFCVISDSGTVQEECCIFHVPTVTIRDTTERPETVECGSNLIAGLQTERIVECVDLMLSCPKDWSLPEGYGEQHVSTKIAQILAMNLKLGTANKHNKL